MGAWQWTRRRLELVGGINDCTGSDPLLTPLPLPQRPITINGGMRMTGW